MPYPLYWTPEKLTKLKSLYDSGLSMKEVATQLRTSLGSINHIMRRANIPRRLASATNHIQFIKSPLSFHPKTDLSLPERELKIAGLMIYWGEGGKRNISGIDLANSDPQMISIFLIFLRRLYQVDEKRLRVYLYTYNSLPTQDLINYWSKITQIPPTQFTKPYIRTKSNLIHDKMQYGLIHIRYADLRLFNLIMSEIKQFVTSYTSSPVGTREMHPDTK